MVILAKPHEYHCYHDFTKNKTQKLYGLFVINKYRHFCCSVCFLFLTIGDQHKMLLYIFVLYVLNQEKTVDTYSRVITIKNG